MESPARTLIGRFHVEALLGSGGMGQVYRAFDPTLQRTVAVKTVRADIDRPEFFDRLYREAQACARLQHPNIVTVYEAGELDGVVYIAMEYLKGDDLAAVLRRHSLPFEGRLRILIDILDALEHAHQEGVIHRDIKPSNVYVRADGSVKLVDFGLARITTAATLTASGAVMGTPHYASPEQLKGEDIDKRTDIYSTGALAYEMFTGRRPFEGSNDSVTTIIFKVVSEPPAPMNVPWSRTFPEIERIVSRAMAKSRDERFQTAAEMRSALATVLASSADSNRSEQIVTGQSGNSADEATIPIRRPELAQKFETPGAISSQPSDSRSVAPLRSVDEGQLEEPRLSVAAQVVGAAPRSTRGVWWMAGAAAAVVLAATVLLLRPLASPASIVAPPVEQPPAPPSRSADAPIAVPATVGPGTQVTAASDAPGVAARDNGAIAKPSVTARDGTAVSVPPSVIPPLTAPDSNAVAEDVSAKQLFKPGVNAGLRYRLIQQLPGKVEADVDPATPFHSGDRVRFAFESNIDGFLYVVQQGSTGRWTVLFPDPDINGGLNAIKRFEQYHVPSDDWFAFDENPGTERVFVFLSREPLNQLPGFNAPVTRTETVSASVVGELQASVKPRDLVLQKDPRDRVSAAGKVSQSTYVVNRDEVGKAVAAVIELIHGR